MNSFNGLSFDEIVEKYSDMITRICILNLKNTEDAKDCFQNTFLKLYLSNKAFTNDEYLKAWLIRVCVNECKNYRYYWHRNSIQIEDVVVSQHQNDLFVIFEIMKLPKKQRNILYLYYYEGYKVYEIAQMLKMKENTVKSHLKRARDNLKERLGEFYE